VLVCFFMVRWCFFFPVSGGFHMLAFELRCFFVNPFPFVMMRSFILPLILLGAAQPVFSQGETEPPPRPAPDPAGGTFIPSALEVPVFVPPAPVVRKDVPVMRRDAVVTAPVDGGRTVTIIRGEKSELPDIPVTPQSPPTQVRRGTADEIRREVEIRRSTVSLGATVFDHRLSIVNWKHPDTGEDYEAVCGFDVSLLEGVGELVSQGKVRQLQLFPILCVNDRHLPSGMPQVAEGGIVFLKGDPDDGIGTAPLLLVKDLITNEKARLTAYQAARKNQMLAEEAWREAHPVVPRNETFWLRPHRGSRYLENPVQEGGAK